jgi:hypothetical protein
MLTIFVTESGFLRNVGSCLPECMAPHSRTLIGVKTLWQVWHQLNCAQVCTKYVRSTVYVGIHTREATQNPIPAHRNLIGHGMTALPPVSSPSSILQPPSSHCAFIRARQNPARFSKMLLCRFFTCLKLRNLQLRKSGMSAVMSGIRLTRTTSR